ncbi:MAG: MFS transporter [Candidatus Poribacteria bacterium]|nr:MAG: MFS transporter [Candidatus Poribacteria bacterium]
MGTTVRALRAYLELIRYPLFAIPVVATLPGIVLSAPDFVHNWRAWLALLVAELGYFAGMIKNDYFHRGVDRLIHPERPIPSGRVRPETALRLASGLYLLCVALGFLIRWQAGLLVLLLIAISHSYNAYLKERGLWGSLVLPLGIGLLNVFGAISAAGRVPPMVWVAFGITFLYDFGTHVISTFKDYRRDAVAGVRTTVHQLGPRVALIVSVLATLGAFGLAFLPLALGYPTRYVVWPIGALIATMVTRYPLLRSPSEANGYRALEGAMLASILLFPALVGVVWSVGQVAAVIVPLWGATLLLLHRSRQEV